MAIIAGLYALTLEKMMIDTLGQSIEAETHKSLLVDDVHAPDFTLDDFRDQIDNEASGAGYSTGGVTQTVTDITIAAGILTFDMLDTVYPTVTIVDQMGQCFYTNVGSAATDQLVCMQDFITAASATAADFTVQHSGTGVFTIDVQP